MFQRPAALLAAALVAFGIAGLGATPASAATAHCTSLAIDGGYIVGSCTPAKPGPSGTITLIIDCHIVTDRTKTITIGYGASFRTSHGCWGGAKSVTYNPWR